MKYFLTSAIFLLVLAFTAALPSRAQQTAPSPGATMPMPMPSVATPVEPGTTPAEGSMMAAMDKMSRDMAAVPMTGDTDREFAAMMIPHHQGAIEMARNELAHGKDPAMMKLAREVVAAQEKEIVGMKAWLGQHPAAR